VLALYVWFPALREAPGLQPWWQFATFTLNLLIDYNQNQAFSHAWSLCAEEHFYLVFPLLAWWLTRQPSTSKFIGVCVAVVVLGIALRTSMWLHDTALDPPRNWFLEDIYYPTWMRLDGLLMGIMLAALRVYRPQAWARLQTCSNVVLLGGIAVSCLALWLFRDRGGLHCQCARLAAAVVRLRAAGVCRRGSPESARPLAATRCRLAGHYFL
jgi:peptidoglycan/LPS O-acetylase OafA/YrhL